MRLSVGAAAGVLFLLAGASANAGTRSDQTIAPGEGALLLTVAVDHSAWGVENIANATLQIPNLMIEKVDEPGHPHFQLRPRLDGLVSARGYAGSLPPGRYRIFDLMGGDDMKDRRPTTDEIAEFDVVSGEVTWLGSVMTRYQRKTQGKDFEDLWAYQDEPDLAVGQRILDGLYKGIAASKPVVARHWQPFAKGAPAAAQARATMRADATGLNGFNRWGATGFCFGAQHGVAKCWNPVEGYQQLDTGSYLVLRSVLRREDGRVLAGGEASTLIYSSDGGVHWNDAGVGLPWGIVGQIEDIGNDEVLFELVQADKVRLYRGPIDAREWKLLGEYSFGSTFVKSLQGAFPFISVQGRAAILTLPTTKAVYFDLDSGESHDMSAPGTLVAMSLGTNGVLRCLCGLGWKESHDEGRTWQGSGIDRFMITMPAFRDANEGFTYKSAFLSKKGSGIFATRDGGKTWSSVSSPMVEINLPMIGMGWSKAAYSGDGSVMVVAGAVAYRKERVDEFQVSTDGGKSWTRGSKLPVWALSETQ